MTPAYIRVAGAIRDRITDGELKPGAPVPGRADLCREYGCSITPVTKALTALEREGAIRRLPGAGYQVLGADDAQAGPPEDLRAWARIADVLAGRIERGEYQAGDVLRRGRVAADAGLSVQPVTRAFAELARRGLIARTPAHGWHVLAPSGEPGDDDPREYMRVARVLLGRILGGELRAGDPVPSKSVLARELGVSHSTVMRAFGRLAGQGVIRRVPGQPYRVCANFTVSMPDEDTP